jgi:hypothetical protein
MAILLALSTLGTIVAGQQYGFLYVEKEVALSRQALEKSFLTAMKCIQCTSVPEMDKELAAHKELIEDVDSSAAVVTGQLEIRAIADFIAWCVVFVISVWALFLNNRKQA